MNFKKVEPCHICKEGGKPTLRGYNGALFSVVCKSCEQETDLRETEKGAIDAWNMNQLYEEKTCLKH